MRNGPNRSSGETVAAISARIVLALFAANTIFNMAARAVGLHWPYSTFLFAPTDLFGDYFKAILSFPYGAMVRPSDFLGLHDRIADFAAVRPYPGLAAMAADPLNPLQMMPLPTLYCLLSLRAMLALDPAGVFVATAFVLMLGFGFVVVREARSRKVGECWLQMSMLSYPMLMVLTRGNLHAGLTALLILIAMLWAARRERPVLAAILLAIAVNIRPNAILFGLPLLLLFEHARLRVFVVTGIAGFSVLAVSSVGAKALFPDFGLQSLSSGLSMYYQVYVVGDMGLWYGSSLYGGLKLIFGYHPGMDTASSVAALTLLVAAVLLYLRRCISVTSLVFVTACTYCLATPVIADYHLLCFVVVPMLAAREGRIRRAEWIAVVSSALLLSPKNYIFFGEYSLQIVLNPLIMMGGAIAIIVPALLRVSVSGFDGGYSRAARAA